MSPSDPHPHYLASAFRLLVVTLACWALSACTRADPAPSAQPSATPSAPWRAQAARSSQRSQRVRFAVHSDGRVKFGLKTRKAAHEGRLQVARGELELDLLNLSATRGHIEVDLTSVRLLDEDEEVDRQASARALNWLDLGTSRPQSERERFRWARFTIETVSDLSREAAHEGRRRKVPAQGQGGAAATSVGEVREVNLTITGRLRFHDYEVVQVVAAQALFHYAAPAMAGAVPLQVELKTRRSFPVSLAAHDVRPRDDHGTALANEIKLLGNEVAREAKVTAVLELTPLTR